MVSRVYILGGGNIGSFIAHSLRSSPSRSPDVTFLLRGTTYRNFLKRYTVFLSDQTTDPPTHSVRQITEALPSGSALLPLEIPSLVVATKTHQTKAAIATLQSRLTRDSTVVLLQNGITPPLEQLFPDTYTRPREIWAGVVTHGINSDRKFSLRLAARGEIVLGPAVNRTLGEESEDRKKPWLVQTLEGIEGTRTLDSKDELLKCQLEKLAANAAINALAAVNGVKNGELLAMPEALETMKAGVREVAAVARAMLGGDLVEGGDEALWRSVQRVVELTGENRCSMLQDLQAGQKTEVRELNGWVVEKATELGLDCKVNKELVEKVKALEREKGIPEVEPEAHDDIYEHPRARKRVLRKVFGHRKIEQNPVPAITRRVLAN